MIIDSELARIVLPATAGLSARPGRAARRRGHFARVFWRPWLVSWISFSVGCAAKVPSETDVATLLQLGQATDSREIEKLVSALRPADREQLRQRQQQFVALDRDQQQKLRDTHQQICGGGSNDIYLTLHRYCAWLATLPEGERADLLELPPAARIEKIKQRQHEVTATPWNVVRTVAEWLGKYARDHDSELYRQLPADVRDRLDRMPQVRDQMRFFMLMREAGRLRDRIQFPPADRVEIERLMSELPEESINQLSARIDFSDPAAVPRELLAIMDNNFRRRFGSASEAMLKRFYESDDLTPQQRDELDRLPPEEAKQQLQTMMMMSRMENFPGFDRRRPLDRRPRGGEPFPRRGRPPGPGAGPPGGRWPTPPPDYPPHRDAPNPDPPGRP